MPRLVLALVAVLLAASAARADDGPMTFQLVQKEGCEQPCAPAVIARGTILLDTHQRFAEFARTSPQVASIHLDSPGGNTGGAVLLGRAFRQYGARVHVPAGAECSSACLYAFLGGAARSISASGRLGVHRSVTISEVDGRIVVGPTPKEATDIVRRYIADMGADPTIIKVAARVDPHSMHYMSRNELKRFRVVTSDKAAPSTTRLAVKRPAAHLAD